MTSDPRAFLALDLGAATSSVALIGRLGQRWRLVGSLALPATADVDAIATELVRRVVAADPDLAEGIGLGPEAALDASAAAGGLPRLVARSAPPRSILACAVSERAAGPLAAAASATGWRTRTATLEGDDPLHLTTTFMDPAVDVLLVGAGDPPGADERRELAELGAIVAGAAARRPDLTIVLAGAMTEQLERLEAAAGARSGEVLLAPAATAGDPAGSALRALLDDIRGGPDDPRRAGRAREHRRLQQPLEIDRHIVGRAPQVADGGAPSGDRRALQRDHAIDHRHELDDLTVLRVHEPVDAGVGKRMAQRRRRGHGMDDVTERAKPHQQDPIHLLIGGAPYTPPGGLRSAGASSPAPLRPRP